MCVSWHELIYDSSAKYRNTPEYQEYMRLFPYIWPFLANNARNRTVGTTYGVARENSEQVYKENVHYHTYCYI